MSTMGDLDPTKTGEWVDALSAVQQHRGSIGKTIRPHPTLGESIGMAAEVFEGHCTDLPPQKKK